MKCRTTLFNGVLLISNNPAPSHEIGGDEISSRTQHRTSTGNDLIVYYDDYETRHELSQVCTLFKTALYIFLGFGELKHVIARYLLSVLSPPHWSDWD